MPEDVRVTIALAVIAVLPGIAVWWLWWRLPKREVARLSLKIRDPKARADVEDSYRKTVGQALGGIAVLLGAGSAYLQFSQQQQASHDLLISNQVSKGFEQLGSEKLVVRLGGIYALEGVMNNSDQYHRPVLEALTAFIREGARANTTTPALPTDIQAALTVIGRRSVDRRVDRINVGGLSLDLRRVDLIDLLGANLTGADLTGANLAAARMNGANLTGANLTAALLTGADLTGANLAAADLTYTDLSSAHLREAKLRAAKLLLADLTGAQIDQAQLDQACGSDVKLPEGLTLKRCPSQSSP